MFDEELVATKRGKMRMLVAGTYESPIGRLTLASDGDALAGLWIEGQRYFGAGLKLARGDAPPIRRAAEWLDAYFAGERPDASGLRLAPRGTPFQQGVWALLREIPWGEVATYGELARRLTGDAGAARAVGAAVGRNPISILIPCHRVIGANGALTGYAGGIERKRWLLRHENARIGR